jgi:hypothetical protein
MLYEVSVAELDDEGFAGELHTVQPQRRTSTWAPRMRAAIVTGIKAGLLPSASVFTIYFALHRTPPPWVRLGSILGCTDPASASARDRRAFVLVTDRIARLGSAAADRAVTAEVPHARGITRHVGVVARLVRRSSASTIGSVDPGSVTPCRSRCGHGGRADSSSAHAPVARATTSV